MQQKLWTRDFSIITIGTFVSMLGSSLVGFTISLLVLDYTKSTFLYALFIVAFNLPKIIMPMIAGPYLDRFSRKKVIYVLDFTSSVLFLGIFLLLKYGFFNYALFLAFAILNGAISSVYQVAYDSLYPNLITEGNLRKAYSISSMIYPLAAVMTPVGAYLYDHGGVAMVFLICAVTFFIAACFETQIGAKETHVLPLGEKFDAQRFRADFREGVSYLKSEPGLLVITAYFAINAMLGEGQGTMYLPYFLSMPGLGKLNYTYVMAFAILGRLIGGSLQYKFRYPTDKKTYIAIFVYSGITVLEGMFLFLPLKGMMMAEFMIGIMGITSYNIRISGTQNYVPDDRRARFNGIFQMATTVGSIAGPLIAGALAEAIPIRALVVTMSALNLCAVYFIMFIGRRKVRPIYNQNL